MKFNQITFNLSLVILVIFAIYTLTYSGLSGLLLCTAISLICASFLDQFEIVVAVTIIFGLFYIYFLRKYLRKFEPFTQQDNAQKIVNRVEEIKKGKIQNGPQGVYNRKIEGFADVNGATNSNGESSQSTPATSVRQEEVKLPKDVINNVTTATSEMKTSSDANRVADIKKPADNNKVTDANKANDIKQKEEFTSASGALFKLGQLPSENKDGAYVDSGSTLLSAMQSLNPDQISLMTSDTKKLIDTQTNLMQVLNQMQPVLADGKKLLDTFSGMFGGKGLF
jgi:hypothetical protein